MKGRMEEGASRSDDAQEFVSRHEPLEPDAIGDTPPSRSSCNPATFARDAAILVAAGYRVTQVTPVDQFRYSAHVELVAKFER